jgi:hypothetical protein
MHIDEAALLKIERTISVVFVSAAPMSEGVGLSWSFGCTAVELAARFPW